MGLHGNKSPDVFVLLQFKSPPDILRTRYLIPILGYFMNTRFSEKELPKK